MKYCDIDFETIRELNRIINRMKMLFSKDYHALVREYLIQDKHIMACIRKHRTLHSDLRHLDFVRLQERDFSDKPYIHNRLMKMSKGFDTLMSFYKG